MFKAILGIIGVIFGLLMMFAGVFVIAYGLIGALDIIKSINEDLYYYVIFAIFGLSSFSFGKALINEITSSKRNDQE